MAKWVFIFAFCASLFFQGLRWVTGPLDDGFIWRIAANSFQTGNPHNFPNLDAYMHPGGPVVLGTAITQTITKTKYSVALGLFFTVFDSFAIAVLCASCYLLRRNLLWPLTVLGLLSFQPLYPDASLYQGLTPPSIIVALLLPILTLFTLYLYENPYTTRTMTLGLWGIMAGFIAANRIDIGGVMVLAFLGLLIDVYKQKKLLFMAFASFIAFYVFDPYMWFAPVTQIKALLSTVGNHYTGYIHVDPSMYLAFFENTALLSVIGMLIAVAFIFFPKKLISPIPLRFLRFFLVVTIIVYEIFLTASFQAIRYILPLVFVWDMLTPLFMFSIISQLPLHMMFNAQKSQKMAKFCFSLIAVAFIVAPPGIALLLEITKNSNSILSTLKLEESTRTLWPG
jgi:hypothetical protein